MKQNRKRGLSADRVVLDETNPGTGQQITKGVFEDMLFNAIVLGRPLPPLGNKHVKHALHSLKQQNLIHNIGTKKKPNWRPVIEVPTYEDGVVPDEVD